MEHKIFYHKRIALLGSTGSIGTQTLEVVRRHPDRLSVEVLTAWSNADSLIEQALEFKPNMVVIGREDLYEKVNAALRDSDVKVFAGAGSLNDAVTCDSVDVVVTALLGAAGLEPTLRAIEAGKPVALANKETLVAGGELVVAEALKHGVRINPIDSEHSAIFQCLAGEAGNEIEKIFLTGSGGPFRGWTRKQLAEAKPEQALRHPTWQMGRKITIDSATLMNKGLEMIEAKWLFGVEPSQIEVVIQPESIIHSLISLRDGSIKAQMGLPDMKLPIQYALSFPERWDLEVPRLDFAQLSALHFEKPDTETFRCLALAYEAIGRGGNMPCIMNAANEVAVQAFLDGRIGFLQIAELIEEAMKRISFEKAVSLEVLEATDRETRRFASEFIQ